MLGIVRIFQHIYENQVIFMYSSLQPFVVVLACSHVSNVAKYIALYIV